jgi:hypothetical protein
MSRILLLDLDGVVLRSPRPLRRVGENCTRYVAKKLKIPVQQAAQVNRELYSRFGHTLLGLKYLYNTGASMKEFNDHVYDVDALTELGAASGDPEFEANADNIRRALADTDMSVYIFSNAPIVWCAAVCCMMRLGIKGNRIIHGLHPVLEGSLKPEAAAYARAEQYVRDRHGDDARIHYIDDSLANLIPVVDRWEPVWFAADDETQPLLNSPKIQTIRSLNEI